MSHLDLTITNIFPSDYYFYEHSSIIIDWHILK